MTGPTWLLAHAAVTWFLAGLIWTVHLVHYPLMADVGRDRFGAYHAGHTRRIGWIVMPAMLAELVLAVGLAVAPASPAPRTGAWVGVALLAGVWLSTAFVQVPQHRRLAAGFDAETHRRLVRGNLPRTLLWSARAVLATLLLVAPAA